MKTVCLLSCHDCDCPAGARRRDSAWKTLASMLVGHRRSVSHAPLLFSLQSNLYHFSFSSVSDSVSVGSAGSLTPMSKLHATALACCEARLHVASAVGDVLVQLIRLQCASSDAVSHISSITALLQLLACVEHSASRDGSGRFDDLTTVVQPLPQLATVFHQCELHADGCHIGGVFPCNSRQHFGSSDSRSSDCDSDCSSGSTCSTCSTCSSCDSDCSCSDSDGAVGRRKQRTARRGDVSCTATGWPSLHPDLLSAVMSYLLPRCYGTIARTCALWRQEVYGSHVWLRLHAKRWGSSIICMHPASFQV